MKRLLIFLLLPVLCYGQTLVDTPQGDEIHLPENIILENATLLAKVNTSTESAEIKYIFSNVIDSTALVPKQLPLIFGFKVKAVDGIGNIYSKGDFQGAMAFNVQSAFFVIDKFNNAVFFAPSVSYDVERLTLMYPDRPFAEQIDKSYFKGLTAVGQIGYLMRGSYYFTVSSGYSRKNNYKDLTKITINDFTIIEEGNISREYGPQETGRIGNFQKFDRYPTRLTFSYLPDEFKEDSKRAKLGGSLYYFCDYGNTAPLHTIGVIGFLTKQDNDSGIRIPTIGIGIQAKDVTDNMNMDNAFEKRLSVNVSATLSLL